MTIVCSLCGWAHTRSECPKESKTASRSSAESGHMTYNTIKAAFDEWRKTRTVTNTTFSNSRYRVDHEQRTQANF